MRGLVASAFRRKILLVGLAVLAAATVARARLKVEVLRATYAIPAHIAGAFAEPYAFQQTDAGQYFVFDRRAHAVYTIVNGTARKVVEIGAEPGRVLQPSAFDIDPSDGTFVVADAPLLRERVQTFTSQGSRMAGFTLSGRELPRITFGNMVLNGIGSLQFTGSSLLINQPETGALISELDLYGTPKRTFGQLRATGHEADRDLHLALNVGLPLVNPIGGYYFVFQSGVPLFRKYDRTGKLLFERHVEGPEVDQAIRDLPTQWPQRRTPEGDVIPLVPPTVRTAAVDRQGHLWVSLVQPYTYVYDEDGEKIRTVQFRGADVIGPDSLFFTKDGRVLVTPGLYEFKP
jgi:hypothetical protein